MMEQEKATSRIERFSVIIQLRNQEEKMLIKSALQELPVFVCWEEQENPTQSSFDILLTDLGYLQANERFEPPSSALLLIVEHNPVEIKNALTLNPQELLFRPLNRAEILFRLHQVKEKLLSPPQADPTIPSTGEETNSYASDSASILLVEDNRLERTKISDFLESLGYQIYTSSEVEEAYQYLKRNLPDLVLLDLMLPEISGFNLLQQIRKEKKLFQTPVIIISAFSDHENKLKCLEIGADDYIQKPINLEELKARINSVLRKKFHFEQITRNYHLAVKRAITDSLTGLYNHGYFYEFITQEIERCRRYHNPLTLVLLDIDHFKNYNDLHGHPQGDLILKTVGDLIKQNTRQVDLAARYGGEEFALVLTETDLKGGLLAAEKIRYLIESYPFPNQENQPGENLTVSLGVSSIRKKLSNSKTPDLINQADRALYLAKKRGRNQVAYLE